MSSVCIYNVVFVAVYIGTSLLADTLGLAENILISEVSSFQG